MDMCEQQKAGRLQFGNGNGAERVQNSHPNESPKVIPLV